MDIDDFLIKELNIRGKISNLIHKLTYEEVKRLILTYAELQRLHRGDLPKQRGKRPYWES
jgi:porphobilinogen deaminase